EPRFSLSWHNPADVAALALNVFTSGLGIFLIEVLRRARAKSTLEALERKEAEEALKQSQAALLAAKSKLESHADDLEKRVGERTEALTKNLRFMEEFLYSMAHDLRAPVRAVKGFTEALVEDYTQNLDETAQDYGKRISDSCERMDRMITELLEYGRLSHTELHLRPIKISQVLVTVLDDLRHEIQERNAKVKIDFLPQLVHGNEVALRQIFRNLISNAIKFVPPDRTPEVLVWSEQRGSKVALCVQDNGIGIAANYVAKIFKPFQRLHTQDQFAGVGMGLAIARLAAERMGAQLDVTSKPDSGSCFCLEIDCARPQPLLEPGIRELSGSAALR
ncbi:MAG: sensor histidine kinase, partial [Limisphaerales bacterium]